MEKFLSLTSSGAISGAVYSLIAVGLVLTYSATRVFNLGYGAIAYATAYVYYQLHNSFDWPIVPSALVAILVFAPGLGWLLDRLIFRKLAGAGEAAKIMATVGILVALPAMVQFIIERLIINVHWKLDLGTQIIITPGLGPSPKETWLMPGGWVLDSDQVIVFVTAVLCAVGLWLLMRHTPLGLRMRAVVDRPVLAQLRGVNRSSTSSTAWVIGTFLAGLAGVVGAPVFNSLRPNSFTSAMIVAIAAAVLAGLRSIPIAALAGIAIGITQNLVTGYASFADKVQGFNESVPYVLLFAGLILLNVDRSRRAGSVSDESPRQDPTAGLSAWRRVIFWMIGLGALSLYLFVIANPFWLGITTKGLAFALVLLSFVIVTGLGGMVSLAQSAFVTAAGLVTGLCIVKFDVPYLLAAVIGVTIATVLGIVVALPALRLGGLPLALATLALALLGDKLLFAWPWLRNGNEGWQVLRPSLIRTDKALAVALLILIVAVAWLIQNVQRSATGRAIAAVRSAESAAACSGVSPVAVKLLLFATSAVIAGVGGVMLVTFDQRAVSTSYPAQAGLVWLAAIVLWGVRRPAAAVVAGISVSVFPALLQNGFSFSFWTWEGAGSTYVADVLFGLGAIQMASDPDGIFAQVSRRLADRRALKAGASGLESVIAAEQEAIDAQVRADEAKLAVHARPAAPVAVAEAGPAALEVHGVVAGYGDVEVLHGIDLRLSAGSVCALVGANGAGKSTLCSVIAGLVPVTAGAVLFEGEDITTKPAHLRARQELLVAPEARGIFPGLSVEDNLRMRLSDDEIVAVFDRFNVLGDRRKVAAGNLSGGEQQLLTLAPVVTRPPRVLIADEPTLGLAPLIVDSLMELFGELRDQGVSLLLVEEKARRVLELADQVAFLELGHVLWLGPRADVDEAELGAAYLGGGPMSLVAQGLVVRFGGVTAVDGVDLDVPDAQIVGLIGPNGAGKTTLFDTLSGVTPPTSGRVLLDGADVTKRTATWRARHGIRRTFQRQQAFGWLSVEDNLLVALDWHGGGGGPLADFFALPTRTRRERERRTRVDEVIELCGLDDVRHEPAGQLPIGRARMVELARAVVDPPRVLLLDEPTSGLQHSETERLAQIVVAARDRFQCAVVLIEHDVGFVMDLAERVVALHLGRILADGTPAEVRSDQAVAEAYLG